MLLNMSSAYSVVLDAVPVVIMYCDLMHRNLVVNHQMLWLGVPRGVPYFYRLPQRDLVFLFGFLVVDVITHRIVP